MNIIPRPPQEVFQQGAFGSGSVQLTQETNYVYKMQKFVLGGQEYAYFDWESISKWVKLPRFEGLQLFPITTKDVVPKEGQFVYFQELLYPRKGFPFPEVLWAVNVFKRVIISLLQSLLVKEMALSFIGFLILPWFIKKRIIKNFLLRIDDISGIILQPYTLKESYRMAPAKEFDRWITLFIENLGFKSLLGLSLAMIIEYDSAYTLRFQDIMTEARKDDLIKNPSKELGRLLSVFATRESRPHLNKKIGTIIWGLRILFLLPRIRKAFIKATTEIDFSKLALTEADRYECLFMGKGASGQYLFLGRSADDRWAELEKLHNGKVPQAVPVIGTMQTP